MTDQGLQSITRKSVATSIGLGSIALVSLGAQPLLYGAYAREGVIAESRLGLLGSIEVLAIAIASTVAISLLKWLSPRILAVVGVLILTAGNAWAFGVGQELQAMAGRFTCGLGSGILTGIAAAAIARTFKVGGWSAGFLFGQALTQYALVQAFSVFNPGATSIQVQLSLSALALAGLALVPALPRAFAALDHEEGLHLGFGTGAIIALFGTLIFTGGVIGFWGYAGIWMGSRSVDVSRSAQLLSLCLAGQMAGSLASILLADAHRSALRFTVLLTLLLAAAAFWLAHPGNAVAAIAFGLAWMMVAPTFAKVILDIDPSRKAVVFIAPAQLIGIALVPSGVGLSLGEGSLDRLMIAFTLIMALSVTSIIPHLAAVIRKGSAPSAMSIR